jgi:hypothetical protein
VRKLTTLDLTLDEQERVRSALHYLRLRFGGWKPLGRALHFEETTLIHAAHGRRTATAAMAFRVARLAKVSVDDLIKGRYPDPNACPRCGFIPTAARTS